MDRGQIITVIRSVSAIDFFDSMNGVDKGIEDELLIVCKEYYVNSLDIKKSAKDIRVNGFKDRLEKIEYSVKNINEEGDEHHLYLESVGLKFNDNILDNLSVLKKRYNHKLNKLVSEDATKDSESGEVVLEEQLSTLSAMFGFRIPPDISLVEFIAYIKQSKKQNNG